ncbi:MAG: TIGR02452 family protein [Legionellaceae bacterium]|nr:TIGR02452 family protein [Legionellaceae bacterium]
MPNKTIAHQYLERTPHQDACELTLRIQNEDCLAVAKTIHAEHGSVCVLNMANQVHVGGDYLSLCALAQEESLIKRTHLLDALIDLEGVHLTKNPSNPYQYALPDCLGFNQDEQQQGFGEFTCLYSSNITVSHLDKAREQPLPQPFEINIISSAAYNLSNCRETLSPELYLAGTVLKIVNQLRTAKAYHQRHLVLGAFGCGAFGNEPRFIAEIYCSAIHELEFVGCFDSISFAVTQRQSGGNYDAFADVFNHALSAPPKPLFNTLMPVFDKLPTHPVLNNMLTPFFKINTQEELIFLASSLIQKEIHALKIKACPPKKAFLDNLLEQLIQNPERGKSILEEALDSPEINTHFPSPKFFKAKPAFLSELNRLILWYDTSKTAVTLFSNDDDDLTSRIIA